MKPVSLSNWAWWEDVCGWMLMFDTPTHCGPHPTLQCWILCSLLSQLLPDEATWWHHISFSTCLICIKKLVTPGLKPEWQLSVWHFLSSFPASLFIKSNRARQLTTHKTDRIKSFCLYLLKVRNVIDDTEVTVSGRCRVALQGQTHSGLVLWPRRMDGSQC